MNPEPHTLEELNEKMPPIRESALLLMKGKGFLAQNGSWKEIAVEKKDGQVKVSVKESTDEAHNRVN